MILIPAIDLQEGKVVRLHKGEFDKVTVYSDDPAAVARKWEKAGAQRLHVVDLDGARQGCLQNLDTIAKIAKSVTIPLQVGGGVRSAGEIKTLLAEGIRWAILGTKVTEDTRFLKDVLFRWADSILVSLDCRDGMVAQRGWTDTSALKGTEFARQLQDWGLKGLIYTDIARDGTLSGPNFQGIEELLQTVGIPVIASGGIAGMDDIKRLCEMQDKGLIGAITGKAIYEGTLDLKKAIRYAQ